MNIANKVAKTIAQRCPPLSSLPAAEIRKIAKIAVAAAQKEGPLMRIALSPAELAVAAGVHRRYVDRAVKEGTLTKFKIGIHQLILVSDAADWIRNRKAS
jgi:hypothetical protein